MKGLFVTGTDTNVGKTSVSAALMHRLRSDFQLRYWKPIQTGAPPDDDTETVRQLGNCAPEEIFNHGIRLPKPLSPHLSAELAGVEIGIAQGMQVLPASTSDRTWVVEGAGGVFVPINRHQMMIDLIAVLDFPVVIVGRAGLGTINHTLLTLAALRARSIPVTGVVLTGDGIDDNPRTIAEMGEVAILGRMPHMNVLTAETLRQWAKDELDRENRLVTAIEGISR